MIHFQVTVFLVQKIIFFFNLPNPPCKTFPKKTSSILSPETFVFSKRDLMASDPNCGAVRDFKHPSKDPSGVLLTAPIKTGGSFRYILEYQKSLLKSTVQHIY